MTMKEKILVLVGKQIDRIEKDKSYVSINLRWEAGIFKMIKTENTHLGCDLEKIINS